MPLVKFQEMALPNAAPRRAVEGVSSWTWTIRSQNRSQVAGRCPNCCGHCRAERRKPHVGTGGRHPLGISARQFQLSPSVWPSGKTKRIRVLVRFKHCPKSLGLFPQDVISEQSGTAAANLSFCVHANDRSETLRFTQGDAQLPRLLKTCEYQNPRAGHLFVSPTGDATDLRSSTGAYPGLCVCAV